MKKSISIFLFLIIFARLNAQIIDKYGISFGASYSNQLSNNKIDSVQGPTKDYKIGFLVFIYAEKKLNKTFGLKTGIGYLEKGFKHNYDLYFPDGSTAKVKNKNVVFHDLCLDLGLKITSFKYKISPYATIGFRGDYMITYKDIIFEEPASGIKFNFYKHEIEKFNKMNLNGLIAIGCEFKKLYYLEFEFDPAITNKFKDSGQKIKDICWCLKLGINFLSKSASKHKTDVSIENLKMKNI